MPDDVKAAMDRLRKDRYRLVRERSDLEIVASAYMTLGERQPDTFAVFADGVLWEPTYKVRAHADAMQKHLSHDHSDARVVRVATFVKPVEDGDQC